MEIRLLREREIKLRFKTITDKYGKIRAHYLPYIDARGGMKILDEVFSPLNWQSSYNDIGGNLFCTISIWDEDKKVWVSKSDVGTESNIEKVKGETSDAFKRACVSAGIGRELYTFPPIWIEVYDAEVDRSPSGTKLKSWIAFHIDKIEYNQYREVVKLIICDNDYIERFVYVSEHIDISTMNKSEITAYYEIHKKKVNNSTFLKEKLGARKNELIAKGEWN